MAEMMRLQIVTPDEAFFDGEVSMVELNTADGETGIYPKHIPMVVAVAPGVLKIHGACQRNHAILCIRQFRRRLGAGCPCSIILRSRQRCHRD